MPKIVLENETYEEMETKDRNKILNKLSSWAIWLRIWGGRSSQLKCLRLQWEKSSRKWKKVLEFSQLQVLVENSSSYSYAIHKVKAKAEVKHKKQILDNWSQSNTR